MATVTAGVLALSTATQLRSSKKTEQTARRIAGFNAEVARQNAEIAIKSSELKAEDIREETGRVISRHRAAFASSNLVTTSGSPFLAQLRQAEVGEESAQDVILQGKLQAAGFSAQEELDKFKQETFRQTGKLQRNQILLSGLSGAISTAQKLDQI